MVDHHVDRPGVKVEQSMQLTGPNHPIEFNTAPSPHPHTQQSFIANKQTHQNQPISFDRLEDLVALAGSLHPIPSRTRT